MPRPGLPPTPGSSTDIKGKDGTQQLTSFQLSFELPPPAIHDATATASTVSPTDAKSKGAVTFPMQPAETVKARRRSSAAAKENKDTFALPPPPTRSRKIIQMKPRTQDTSGGSGENAATAKKETTKRTGAATNTSKGAAAKTTSAAEKKKSQPSATSAAGRKIARKTAHSLIERRRRSKMNEEFAVLKSMIPACTGEMHKLSILQASIEYVRYLEDCVAKLKAQNSGEDQGSGVQTPTGHNKLPSIVEFHPTFHDEISQDVEVDVDVDMSDSDAVSPTFTAQSENPSPALPPQDHSYPQRHHSYSSVSTTTTDQRHYSFSTTLSPALGPQPYAGYARSEASAPGSALTSPALQPQTTENDQEAMAALLMLNHDRRGTRGSGSVRGLSVRDLLSST